MWFAIIGAFLFIWLCHAWAEDEQKVLNAAKWTGIILFWVVALIGLWLQKYGR